MSEQADKKVETEVKQVDKKGEDYSATLLAHVGPQREPVHLMMVADGHGGPEAAQLCSTSLLDAIARSATSATPDEISRAMRACFLSMHRTICETGTTSGAAVTCIAIVPATSWLIAANVGDVVSSPFPCIARL